MTRRVAFIDTVCPSPYTLDSLARGALGGTEATIVRIAEALDADVFQRGRATSDGRYHPLEALTDPEAMIVLRDPKAAAAYAERFPGVPLFVWMHDLIVAGKDRATRLRSYADPLSEAGAKIVAVSDFHRDQIRSVLESAAGKAPEVVRVYNPLAPGLAPVAGVAVDRDQLVYFSSAAKGLDFAIFMLHALRRRWPAMQLLVANPGYARVTTRRVAGVVDLGALPQHEVLAHVSRSLCTLCTNFEFPETFGLVLAESNAVGTPVLAHPVGAAAEVLGDSRQIVDVPPLASFAYRASRRLGHGHTLAAATASRLGGFASIVDRIGAWRDGGRPAVHARPEFAIDAVVGHWRALLVGSSRRNVSKPHRLAAK